VVKIEDICNLRKDVTTSAVPDISRFAFLASYRIKFRENNFVFVCFYILLFIYFIFKLYFKVYSSNHRRKISRS